MADKEIINIMCQDLENPAEDEAYNEWYNVHLPENFKFKGITKAARYKRIGDDESAPQYIAIYHFKNYDEFNEYNTSPERAAAAKVGKRPESVKVRMRAQYELINSWEK